MRYIIMYILMVGTLVSQRITGDLYLEFATQTFGAGGSLILAVDSSIAFSAGFIYSQEYRDGSIPGTYAWSPPAPHSWWRYKGDYTAKKKYPGITVGLVFLNRIYLSAMYDNANYEKYKLWYSPAIDSDFHTKNGSATDIGYGLALGINIGYSQFIALNYHFHRGIGIRYGIWGL